MQRTVSPDTSDNSIEQEIVAKGANTGPRLTPDMIEAQIKQCFYINVGAAIWALRNPGDPVVQPAPELDMVTICVLVLRNGFVVTGKSGVLSPENFNQAIGEKIARNNAVQEIWALEGYRLKQTLYVSNQRSPNQRPYELNPNSGPNVAFSL